MVQHGLSRARAAPQRVRRSELTAVRCTAAARLLGRRGFPRFSTLFDRNQALHWNGKGWLVVPTPSPGAALQRPG